MKKIKEITVFSNGDSNKISTWSNVPFFFTETLFSKGIKVNRVDISPPFLLEKIANITVYYFLGILYKNSAYNYFRSLIHFVNVRYRIKKAIKQYPNSDAHIFLTFSFSSVGLTKKPIVQFCDWTYDHYINYFLDRKPNFFEKQCIKREDSQIEGADLIFPLFPSVAKYMMKRYKNENIYYLGNVINSWLDISETDVMESKENSNKLLFVGSKKYIEGAQSLINAFEILKQNYPALSLHIIGMNNTDFKSLPKDIHCYGYLDKGKNEDREIYYKLFKEAKVFINTTPKWGAFSATVEAMFFYTPIVITPYDDFVETFGRDIDFGYYCEKNSPLLIKEKITKVLNNKFYNSFCYNSHNSVKEYTWDAYIDKLIKRLEEKINDC
ncbi:MAG: glycosyltransferase [Methylobacter sp.]|nr:glycosyltransferase [Methylobacter sp.]